MWIGVTVVGTGIVATQVPVHTRFLANLSGPFVVSGAGTAFVFIPPGWPPWQGVSEQQSGLAAGVLNSWTQFGGALGTAVPSSVGAAPIGALLPVARCPLR